MEFEWRLYRVGKTTSSSNSFGQLTYIQKNKMLQRGNQCYIKDETLGNKAYSALCLLAIELVSNNAMLRYFLFFF
jgi:hypothetical protein